MSLQPLRDFIVVAKPVEEEKTESGLIFKPATADSKVSKSKVLAAGSGRVTMSGTVVPLEVKEGDTVFFNKHHATELADGSQTVFLLREDQVLAVVK
jgi:chaperonin GroES